MQLSESGESRVNGYLFVLERSLGTFLPRDVMRDAVREIESHLRERIASATAVPDERAALEKILLELGPPLRVAQAYSVERTVDEAITTGRLVPMARAIWHLAVSTVLGFFVGLGVLTGYLIGGAFLFLAMLKPVFPENVGIWVRDSSFEIPLRIAATFPKPPNEHVVGGYWVIPFCLIVGLAILVFTHRGARRYLSSRRRRRAAGLLREE